MASATFDSNVWRPIATPSRFPNEASLATYERLRALVAGAKLDAFLSETVFTLEQIKKGDRKSFLSTYRPSVRVVESEKDGAIKLSFSIGPPAKAHRGNPPVVEQHLQDALAIGMLLLRAPRIAGVGNPDIADTYFVQQDSATATGRQERFGECLAAIESHGGGMAQIKLLAAKYAPTGAHWTAGVAHIPAQEDGLLIKAVAEWADGDAIAAHYAYENDVFCTKDVGNTGGSQSVLSPANRAWLTSDFGVTFENPETLEAQLSI
jgi:hypothetical protein